MTSLRAHVPPVPWHCPDLVGRDAELAAVIAPLDASPAGGTVLVVGEAGIGKSRLLREASARARDRGVPVLLGRATPDGASTAYRPLAEAFAAVGRHADALSGPDLAPYRAAVGRLAPGVGGAEVAVAHAPVPVAVPVLAEGLLRLLRALGGPRPAVLIVEDLHWADAETLAVVDYLADHAPGARVVLLGSSRPAGGAGSELVDRLGARRAATVVELQPLEATATRTMAARCLDAATAPAGLEALLDRSDGLPFHVEELLVAAAREGVLVHEGPEGAERRWTVRGDAARIVPATFARSVGRRWEALDHVDREVLGVAALLGRRIDLGVVVDAVGQPIERVAAALGAGAERGLVTVDRAGYGFRHALTRDAVLDRTGARPDLAARTHEALLRSHPGLPGRWCRTAAELAAAAGHADVAAQHWLETARRARDDGALVTARDALVRAADHVGADRELALDVAEMRTEVETAAGDVDATSDAADSAFALDPGPDRALRLHLQLADAEAAATRWDAAAARLARVRELAGEAEDLGRADAMLAHVRLGQARGAEAEALARGVLDTATDAETSCRALEVLGRSTRTRDVRAAEDLFVRQRKTADSGGLVLWALRATHELGGIDLMTRNDTARLHEALGRAIEVGAAGVAATVELQLSASGWVSFDPEEMLEHARRCLAWGRVAGGLLEAEALSFMASAHAVAGRRDAMEETIVRVAAVGRDEPDLAAGAHVHRGLLALFRDDVGLAADEHDAAVARVRDSPLVYVRPWWQTWSLLRTVLDRDGDAARAEVRQLTQPGGPLEVAWLHYGDAVAAGRAGDAERAEALVAEARALLAAPGLAPRRHVAEHLVAPCALAAGWGDPGTWAVEGSVFFRRAGHSDLERSARSLARRAGARLPRREHGHRAEMDGSLAALGVTDREAEVLALVAAGLTNREVAERLGLSVRTVDKHVEHLMTKTGRRRRAELRELAT